jgi:general nucleoside transport system permease protein
MAAPAARGMSPQSRPPTSKLSIGLRNIGRNIGSTLSRPLFAVVLAMIAGGIVIMFTSPGTISDRFFSAVNAYQALFLGSLGNPQSLSFTLVRVGPLILTGLSVAIAFRAGLFNIGAEGQLAVGAMTAGIIGFKLSSWPGWALIILMILGSIIAGAIWGGIVGLLKAWRGAHEVVTTIMLNWIAFYVTDYLIDGPFKAPNQADQTSSIPLQATLPRISDFYNATLGKILPPIAGPDQYLVDIGFFFAIAALIVYWFIVSRTTFGYEIRIIGQNPKAARYAGIPIGRNLILTMALSGAFAGLAGALHLMGQFPYQLIATTFAGDPTGFDAIGVALLGRTTAVGVLIGSLLFGGLRQGALQMQLDANIPVDLVFIIQALILFSIASEFLSTFQRFLPQWMRFSSRPMLAANITGTAAVDLPEETTASAANTNNALPEAVPASEPQASSGEEDS